MEDKKNSSKSIIMTASLLAVPLLIMSLVGGFLARDAFRQQKLSSLESLATVQKNGVEQIIANYGTVHKGIASRTQLRANLQDFNTSGSATAVTSLNKILLDARAPFTDIQGLFVLGGNAAFVAGQQDIKIPANLYQSLYERGSKSFVVQTIEVDGKPVILHAAPIQQSSSTIGVLVIVFSPDSLKAITHTSAGLGETGETVLGYRSADGVVLFPTRLQTSAKPIRISKNSNLPVAPTLINKQDISFKKATDYRGSKVLAATRYIKEADWAVVTKQDQSEVFRELDTFLAIYTFLSAVIIPVSVGALLLTRSL